MSLVYKQNENAFIYTIKFFKDILTPITKFTNHHKQVVGMYEYNGIVFSHKYNNNDKFDCEHSESVYDDDDIKRNALNKNSYYFLYPGGYKEYI